MDKNVLCQIEQHQSSDVIFFNLNSQLFCFFKTHFIPFLKKNSHFIFFVLKNPSLKSFFLTKATLIGT